MNILFLARLYKPHVGGVEKHVEEISKILAKNHSVTIITEQHSTDIPETDSYPEAKVYRIPVIGCSESSKKYCIWKWWFNHLNLISSADVIHVHDVFFWLLPFRIFFPRKRIFITFHGYEGSGSPGLRQIFWHKLGEWLTLGNICIGDFHRKWYHTSPDVVSYGAVAVKDRVAGKKTNRLMYLGRLASDAGIMEYLVAVKHLALPIDIYGDGPLRRDAEAYCEKNHINANFLGFVPGADQFIPGYKLVFTSRYLGILEALAARVPVITYYDSPIKYDYLVLSPFARMVDICADPDQILAAAKKAIQSPASHQTRIREGYNWAKKQTWSNLVKIYSELWEKKSSTQP